MKTNHFFCLLMVAILMSCSKTIQDAPPRPYRSKAQSEPVMAALNNDLIAYKNSPHQLMMGYYRIWADKASTGNPNDPAMTDMPDSVDILSVFPQGGEPDGFWTTLKTQYIPTLHAKGTKVIITTSLADYNWFSGNVSGYPKTPAGYAQWKNDQAVEMGYDGLDLDIERTLSGTDLSNAIAIFQALSVYFGPKSTTGRLLIYDTNQNGNGLMNGIKEYVSYVFLQTYWRNVTSLTGTLNTYTPYIPKAKFLVGVSFEDGTGHQPGQMPAYTQWTIQNKTGGVFSYGIDQEYVQNRNATSRAAIKAMNPPLGDTTVLISGANYLVISALNNSSVLDVPGSATSNSTPVQLWAANQPITNNQKWKLTRVDANYYTLQPLHAPSLALDVANGASNDGARVQIYMSNGTNAQKWRLAALPGGYFILSPANASTKALDVTNGSVANGTKIQIWTRNGSNAQKWRLVRQ